MTFPPSPNSHGIISFADPHPLTPIESYRFTKQSGEGVPSFRPDSQDKPLTPVLATHPNPSNSKPFVCHTSETPRGVVHTLLTRFPTTSVSCNPAGPTRA